MKPATPEEIALSRRESPSLAAGGKFRNPGEATERYNCMSWALEDTKKLWDPDIDGAYWPDWVPRDDGLAAVLMILAKNKYAVCGDGSLEAGHEKIALYLNCNEDPDMVLVEHVARQLPDGWWTSKLGRFISIEHQTVEQFALDYGRRMLFVKRKRKAR